jgi:hypothetical protein
MVLGGKRTDRDGGKHKRRKERQREGKGWEEERNLESTRVTTGAQRRQSEVCFGSRGNAFL